MNDYISIQSHSLSLNFEYNLAAIEWVYLSASELRDSEISSWSMWEAGFIFNPQCF
jgi:hypothetical protein